LVQSAAQACKLEFSVSIFPQVLFVARQVFWRLHHITPA
jgi:hypothetical protein